VQLAWAGGDLRVAGGGLWPALMAQEGQVSAAAGSQRGRGSRAQTWTSAFYSTGDYDFDEGFTEYDYDTRGFVVGADRLLGEHTIAGFMAGYADTGADEVHAVASADVETWTGGLYATSFWGPTYVEGGISYSTQSFDNQRTLLIDTEERIAVSDHDGSALMLFAGAGREFDFGSWQAEPYGTLYYFDIDEDAFQEEGADSLNLLIGRKSAEAMFAEVGSRFVRLQPVRHGAIDWHAVIAYSHDFDLGDATIGYAYQGMPGSLLQVTDRNVAAGSAVLGAGVAWLRQRSVLAFDYRGQYNGNYRNHMVGLRLSLAF
jgi:outer membrane autotransporter protein